MLIAKTRKAMAEYIKEDFLGQYRVKVSPRFVIERLMLEKGVWEEHILNYINFFVKPGYTCIDVGANCGFHTLAMAHATGPTGRVFAFEPNSVTFPRLVDNVNLNPSLSSRVSCHKIGLSDQEKMLRVYQSGNELGNAYVGEGFDKSLWNAGTEEDFELCIVKPLDSLLRGQPAHFLKIDVEGMEIFVLHGAMETLQQHKPLIVYETLVQDFNKERIQECEVLLRSLGYHLFALDLNSRKLVPCTYPSLQEDTLAIHNDKLIDCAEIVLNASKYMVEGTDLSLIIAAAEDNVPYLRVVGPGVNATSRGERKALDFLFSFDTGNGTHSISLHLSPDLAAFTGSWESPDGRQAIAGRRTGGCFK